MSHPSNNHEHHSYLGIKIVIGIIGLFLSVILHELFHIIMHWDQVPHIGLFPNHDAIVEIFVWIPNGYDLEGEEMVAYGITLLTLLITVMIIFRIHDATDDRSVGQILFPNDKEMQKLHPTEMLKLANLDEETITVLPKSPKKNKRPKKTVGPIRKRGTPR